jgi:hypothetical protein
MSLTFEQKLQKFTDSIKGNFLDDDENDDQIEQYKNLFRKHLELAGFNTPTSAPTSQTQTQTHTLKLKSSVSVPVKEKEGRARNSYQYFQKLMSEKYKELKKSFQLSHYSVVWKNVSESDKALFAEGNKNECEETNNKLKELIPIIEVQESTNDYSAYLKVKRGMKAKNDTSSVKAWKDMDKSERDQFFDSHSEYLV